MSVVGQTLVRRFTSLGDSSRWQETGWVFDGGWWHSSNLITTNLAAFFGQFVGDDKILINIGFQTLAFYGIYRFISALDPSLRKRAILLFFFPSFSVWSSVAGKEAVLIFAIGVISGYLIRIFSRRERLGLVVLIAVYLVYIMKTHYIVALLYIFGAAKFCRYLPKPGLIIFFASVASLFPLYFFREVFDSLSFDILPHFLGSGRSTREPFWVEQYDVFWKAPYGMVQSFLGPTLEEAMLAKNPIHVGAYLEGLAMICILGYFMFEKIKSLPVFNFVVILFGTFWILFPNYPFGIMNPGSAVRYRTGYLMLIILLVIVLGRPETYRRWRGSKIMRHFGRPDALITQQDFGNGAGHDGRAGGLSGSSNSNNHDSSGT